VIKAIVFDCFGVLVQPARTLLYNAYPTLTNQIDDLEHQWHLGIINRHQFEELIADLVGITPEEVKARYYDISVRDEVALSFVRELRAEGKYKIGFLSNVGSERMGEYFPKELRDELFDEVVLSCEVGMVKPEVAIFQLMARRLEVRPSECVMIDDKLINIDGARDAGMQTVTFMTTEQARDDLQTLLERNNA
jgi:epoxide hydrolase-like predicted phosphatase